MKLFFSLTVTLSILFFSSCGNDDIDEPTKKVAEPKASDYFPLKAGNYWVYELFETHPDSSKDYRIYQGRDSIYVVGIKIFENDTFYQVSYNSAFFNKKNDYKYYKDSAGYLIEKPGIKKLSINNFKDTLYSYNIKGSDKENFAYVRRYMEKYDGTIQTPSGVFDSIINLKQRVHINNPNLFPNYPRYNSNLYAKGIGKVYYDFGYLGGRAITECTLVKYKVD